MKKFYRKAPVLLSTMVLYFGLSECLAQITLWEENFQDESIDVTTGNDSNSPPVGADWTSVNSGSTNYFQVRNIGGGDKEFYAKETDGESVWTSEVLDVTGVEWYTSIKFTANGNDWYDGDYLRIYLSFDGGGEQLMYEYSGFGVGNVTDALATSELYTGVSTFQITVRINNDDDNDIFSFDDIYVYEVEDVYTRASGNWNNPSTWSVVSHSGPSCGCIPNEGRNVIIGDDDIVTLDGDGEAVNLIGNSGSLIYGGNYSLSLSKGGNLTVASGFSLDANSYMGSTITIPSSSTDLNIDGLLSIGNLDITSTATINLLGSGSIIIFDDILINADNVNINNFLDLSIGNDIILGTYNAFFTFNYTNATIINNRSLTLTGDFNGGSGTFGNGDFNVINYNNFYHSGNYVNIDGGLYTNGDNAIWDWSGATADPDILLDVDAPNNLFIYSRNGDQTVVSAIYEDITLKGSGSKATLGDIIINGDLTISETSQLNVDAGNHNISIAGNWINNSTNGDAFVQGAETETVTFNGPTEQNISNPEDFNVLNIDKTGNVTLQGNIQIDSALVMTSGYVVLSNFALSVTSNAIISGGSSASFIVTNGSGECVQFNIGAGGRTGDVLFPIGANASSYSPITVNNTTGVADNFSIRLISEIYDEGYSGNSVTSDVVNRTWFINEELAGGSDAMLTFQWNSTEELSGFDRSDLNIVHYNGTDWDVLVTTAGAGTGPYTASVSSVNDFSPFGVEGSARLLPVDLLYFKGAVKDNKVQLAWKTASELNNDYFIIEKTVDFQKFVEVVGVDGQGTSQFENTYAATDFNPYNGVSYYRLKQTDLDGTTAYSNPVRIDIFNSLTEESFEVYPVPGKGDFIKFRLTSPSASEVIVSILDIQGRIIHLRNTSFNQNEEVTIHFNDKLKPGIYTLLVSDSSIFSKQFIVN